MDIVLGGILNYRITTNRAPPVFEHVDFDFRLSIFVCWEGEKGNLGGFEGWLGFELVKLHATGRFRKQ